MRCATEVELLRSEEREVDSRASRIGKVMVAGTMIAGSAMAAGYLPAHHPAADHDGAHDGASSAAVSLASQVLTLRGVVPWSIDGVLQGAVCGQQSGNTCSTLNYPEILGDIGVDWGAHMLDDELHDPTRPQIVSAYSQGAAVAAQWLNQHAADPDAPSAKDLSFVLIGNPKRKYGGAPWAYPRGEVATNTQYTILDVAREYDNVADNLDDPWNMLAMANAICAYFYAHTAYAAVDLVNDEKLVWQEGNTTYVLVRTKNLPLLDSLRYMGLGFVADLLNAPLKAIIDSAYNRNYPNIITDPVAAQKAVDDALRGPHAATPEPISPKRTADFATAAAATAASLFSNPSVEEPSEPTDNDTDPAGTGPLSRMTAKVVAAEDDLSIAQTPPQADPVEASDADTDDAETVGRHRAPEAADDTDTTSTTTASATVADSEPQHAKPAETNAGADDSSTPAGDSSAAA